MNRPSRGLFVASLLLLFTSAATIVAQEANYDEAKVGNFVLPGPLVMRDGRPVTTAEMWRSERRPELLKLFAQQVYGQRPDESRALKFTLVDTTPGLVQGKATRKRVRVEVANGNESVGIFTIFLFVPTAATKPVPAFVGMHLFDSSSDNPIPGKLLEEDAGESLPGPRIMEVIMDRGYAIATLDAEQFCPDNKEKYLDGVLHLLYPGRMGYPGPEEPGAIATWAWALSRALDYFSTDPEIDAKRVTVIGHSRMGKTALWAGAQDERFAIVISNNSGCGGAALSKRIYGETVGRINRVFPHWFCGNFKQYGEHEDRLPIDQHELIALIAPRPVYVASAVEDRWADPRGEFLAAAAADPVYTLLGKAGLGTQELPPVGKSTGQFLGYHLRVGKHALTDYDWLRYLDFADRHLKK